MEGHLVILQLDDNTKLCVQLDLLSLAFDGPAYTVVHKRWLNISC